MSLHFEMMMQKNIQAYSDNELMNVIATTQDNPEKSIAFSELYNRYNSKIYMYCRKVFGDGTITQDIFQETFIHFLKSIENRVQITNVKGYLLKTARHLSLNFRRGNDIDFVEFQDYHVNHFDLAFDNAQLAQVIDSALELLPEEHKKAFILQNYEGLSYLEIAELTQVPLTTVRNRVVRAKIKLRQILAPMLEESV